MDDDASYERRRRTRKGQDSDAFARLGLVWVHIRISSGGSSSKGKQTARRYLERAKGMSVSGEMGVQELEDVLMVACESAPSSRVRSISTRRG